jgi:hypothetical protein
MRCRDRKINHRLYVRVLGDIRAEECRLAAKFLDLGDNLRAFFFSASA